MDPLAKHCKMIFFALETERLCIKLYPWYPLSPSVHKVLIHGHVIIDNSELAVGKLSEEAQEARNKELKRFRNNNSRKISRLATNEDVLHMLLVLSDPYISSMRATPKKKVVEMDDEAKMLLLTPS